MAVGDWIERSSSIISIYSSPGLDSFGFGFYLTCWEFVKEVLLEVSKYFLRGVPLPKFFTSSYVVLIPKVLVPSSYDKFRPINLCYIVYKIFFKIIMGRLTSCLNCIIFHEQGALLVVISIFENISLAQEIAHSINKKSIGGNMILIMDIVKAYDLVK